MILMPVSRSNGSLMYLLKMSSYSAEYALTITSPLPFATGFAASVGLATGAAVAAAGLGASAAFGSATGAAALGGSACPDGGRVGLAAGWPLGAKPPHARPNWEMISAKARIALRRLMSSTPFGAQVSEPRANSRAFARLRPNS